MSATDRQPPRPYDVAAAERLLAAYEARGTAERAYAASPGGRALLAALGGHSPHLADLSLREADTLLRMAERGADAAFATALEPVGRVAPDAGRGPLGAALRRAKRQAGLVVAAADLSGEWGLGRVTEALSSLADTAIEAATALLLREAAARGDLRPARAGGRGSGLAVLGMGKLGARELNYSSDVDLMLLFDPEATPQPDLAQGVFVRLARDLVKLLEERTEEGYVFRTDLRLRPDGAAQPLAVSIPASVAYYGSMGQNWERAAMVKARPVAGDKQLGQSFLDEIRPFVWRRHLDFAMIADIHSIKRQIHAVHGSRGAGAEVAVAGHDVKLGRGGIREIEFTAQVLELIWGGRDPSLRDPTTLGALAALAGAGRLDRRAAVDLADAYNFLRTVEHRLQMVADRQTHRIPSDEDGLARIASFMGFDAEHGGINSFAAALSEHLGRVAAHYGRLFESAPALSASQLGDGGSLVFTGTEDDPDTIATLAGLGYADPSGISEAVRGWHHGRRRAVRSERARELLTELMPALLTALGRQREPDAAFARFDTLLARLPTGVQLLSLFQRNPGLLDRVAGILGAAPALADHLSREPSALEGLLSGGADSAAGALPALVAAARHPEEALEGARRLVTEGRFEIDAAAFEGALDADAAGQARSALAEAAIAALLPVVTRDFASRFGKVRGGGLVVAAMGKLGGGEMLPGSDLDLLLIYDHPEDVGESSGGARDLPAPTYFARLAAQLVAALSTPGAEGRLYEVDMRLRPSGSKGPVATSLESFERYHASEAWTWERMALTRAARWPDRRRCAAASPPLRARR